MSSTTNYMYTRVKGWDALTGKEGKQITVWREQAIEWNAKSGGLSYTFYDKDVTVKGSQFSYVTLFGCDGVIESERISVHAHNMWHDIRAGLGVEEPPTAGDAACGVYPPGLWW